MTPARTWRWILRTGLPMYATQVLVGPKNYYERASAWLDGEALYSDEE